MDSGRGVSLDELLGGRVALTADHAVALVGQLCRRVPIDSVEPSDVTFGPEHVWLDRAGEVHLSPGIEPSVPELGRLLALLISEVRRDASARVPGGLVLVTARATGQLDAAPIVSAGALAAALVRFEPADPHAALRALFTAVEAADTGAHAALVADEEVLALDAAPTAAAPDYDYQEAIAATATLRPEPTIRSFIDRSPWRPAAAAALAAAAFAAGALVALQSLPRPAVPRSQHDGGDHLAPRGHRASRGRSGATTQ